MINILATYKDEMYLCPDIETTEDGYKIHRGYKGNLKEKFDGKRLVEEVFIPNKEVFYVTTCFDPMFDPCVQLDVGVLANNTVMKRLINHSKKVAGIYLLSLTLKDVAKPLQFRQIKRRFKHINILHHITYNQAVDEFGFLFGVKIIEGVPKRYLSTQNGDLSTQVY